MSTELKRKNAEKAKAWYWRNPEKARASARKYAASHREQQSAKHREYVMANKEKIHVKRRDWILRKQYGISSAQYDQMLAAQGSVCAICRTDSPGGPARYFSVDHDHATGAVRGLLCWTCNVGLGAFRDDPEVLGAAASYLAQAREVEVAG